MFIVVVGLLSNAALDFFIENFLYPADSHSVNVLITPGIKYW
jgi:hypothetical protein